VEDYLHLEGMRLGPRLTVEWEWDSALNGVPVPPLLIQPLVENAIKHGIAPSREGGTIRILARRQGADLCLEVWNTGAPFQQGKEAGIGLRNLASRVALVYGAEARFSIQTQGNWTQATVLLAGTLVEYVHDSFKSPRCG
jgi:sensor histidine kinase YesM